MTYTEELTERMTRIGEEVMTAWMDLRLEVGEDDLLDELTPPQERRTELVERAAEIINEIEGIDREAKRKADAEAADAKALQDAINQSISRLADITATPRHLLDGSTWRNVAWLDEVAHWSNRTYWSTFR